MRRMIVVLAALPIIGHAQNSALNNAIFAHKDGDIADAMRFIEPTISHEKTSGNPKAWYWRGKIHQDICTATDEKIKGLNEKSCEIAVASYEKAIELDPKKGESYDNTMQQIPFLWVYLVNTGASEMNTGNNKKALEIFSLAQRTKPEDTTAYVYANYAASNLEDYETLRKNYQKLLGIGYESPRLYASLAAIQRIYDKDNNSALATIEKGKSKFPSSKEVILEEISIYISMGKSTSELREKIAKAIEVTPDDPFLHFSIGTLYDKDSMLAEAEQSYKMAIGLDPDHFDANFNLGALYFNQGVFILNAANTLDLKTYQAEGKKYEEKYKDQFGKALPYFEKASSLRPNDTAVIENLELLRKQLK